MTIGVMSPRTIRRVTPAPKDQSTKTRACRV
nr:MAG TPA: hypothetical protein [Caudoviricetes sp.]